jgi:cyclic-di-GMP phosphodiesterase TipF (flagellum assembly factor)
MASIDQSGAGVRKEKSIADLVVKGAIALVTAAFFIGAYLQFQVTFWLSLIAALSVYITLLMLHALMRRSERVDALVSEVNRLEGEIARMQSPDDLGMSGRGRELRPQVVGQQHSALRPGGSAGTGLGIGPAPGMGMGPAFAPAPVSSQPRHDLDSLPPLPERAVPTSGRTPPPPPSLPGQPSLSSSSAQPGPFLEPPLMPGPRSPKAAAPEQMHDYWSFRPTKQAPETPPPRRAQPVPAGNERESDLEAVQGMIKRLADELSVGGEAGSTAPEQSTEKAIHASVSALHTTAETMRASANKAPPAGGSQRERTAPPSMPPPIAAGHTRLSSVAAAISAGRMDVLMRSIIGLADHKVHHYELVVSPRDEKGAVVPLAVHDPNLGKTGLHPLLDSARLIRASRVCRSLAEAGQRQCVFMPASGESLSADRFLDELANAYRQREALAGELVLTFGLADVKTFGSTEWSALTDMRDLGFRFALDEVTDVDYEFTALRAAGFAFVKFDGARFQSGASGPAVVTAASQMCRQLTEIGLAVIAGGVRDEAMRASVLDAGVPLAEGPLFGAPRAVAPDLFAPSGAAA